MSIIHDFAAIARRVKDPNYESHSKAKECPVCLDSGFEMYSTGHMDPHFRVCEKCGNPKKLQCP